MVSSGQAYFIFFTIRLKNHLQKTLFVRHFYYLNFEPYRKEFRHESSVTSSALTPGSQAFPDKTVTLSYDIIYGPYTMK